jgi:hypothetical protein
MHDQMTTLVGQAVSDGTPIAVSLANTLNNVTSNQASRLAAYRDRLPTSVVFLLYTCAIVTVLLIGREQAGYRRCCYGRLHSAGEHCGLRHTGFESPRERYDPGEPGTNRAAPIPDAYSMKIEIPTTLRNDLSGHAPSRLPEARRQRQRESS